jgi:Na+/melibiose symporter-like transporter
LDRFFFYAFVNTFHVIYAVAMFTTVSNMWTIPINEEAPAERRGRLSTVVYAIGLIPLASVLPLMLVDTFGLDWKWIYEIVFVMMLITLMLWAFMKETLRYAAIRLEVDRGVRRSHFFGVGAIGRRDLSYIAISSAIWICWLLNSFLWLWAGYYFITIHGYSLAQWSSVLLAALLAAIVGGLLSGYVMDAIGRNRTLMIGSFGMAISYASLGFVPTPILPVSAVIAGFFTSFAYTWIIVYVPEIFPTARRGACFGWTSALSRISYILGPALAAVLLSIFPTMQWYWVIAGLVMLEPPIILLIARPFETRRLELEEIELSR